MTSTTPNGQPPTRRFTAQPIHGDGWIIWDAVTDAPADGVYFIAALARAVAAEANRLVRRGRDPYWELLWNDGSGRAIATWLAGPVAP